MSDTPMTREEVLAARKGYARAAHRMADMPQVASRLLAREAYPLPPITRPREVTAGGEVWRWNQDHYERRSGMRWFNATPMGYDANFITAVLLAHGPTETVPDPEDAA